MVKIKFGGILTACILGSICLSCIFDTGEVNLGKGFKYFEDTRGIYYWRIGDSTSVEIPPIVMSYSNSRRFLLVKQRPTKYDNVIYQQISYPSGRDSTYYWLIDKQTKEVTGPLLFSEMQIILTDTFPSQALSDLCE